MPFARGQGNDVSSGVFYGNTYSATYSTSLTFPTIGNCYPVQSMQTDDTQVVTASRIAKGHLTNANVSLIENLNGSGEGSTAINNSMAVLGYGNNIRT